MSNGQIIELYQRRNRLEEAKAAAADDLKEFYVECKGQGYETKALKEAFKAIDNKDSAAAQEHSALVDLYIGALLGAGE